MLTAGYRSRVTGGAGGVSLGAAGEQGTQVAQQSGRGIVPSVVATLRVVGTKVLAGLLLKVLELK